MALTCTVGGARTTFAAGVGDELARVLDMAFGADGDWEAADPHAFGELESFCLADLQRRAVDELGADAVPNLLALGADGRGVYLPAHVRAVSLPLSAGDPLRCASLHGLRSELVELAGRWELPMADQPLRDLLDEAESDDGPVADDPGVLAFARLALAANEAVRRDCPLWLFG